MYSKITPVKFEIFKQYDNKLQVAYVVLALKNNHFNVNHDK